MFTLLVILLLLASVLLVAVVLIQPGQGDMISGMSGLGGFGSMMAPTKTMNLLSKVTIWLAAFLIIGSVITNKFFVGGKAEAAKPLIEGVSLPASTLPNTQQLPALPQQNQNQQNQQPKQQGK